MSGWAISGLMHRSKRTHAGCNASLDHPSAATRPARGNPTTSKAACVFMPERCRCNGASAAMNLLRLCRDECHKAIPVRHAYLRQRLGIHRVVLSDDAVELQDVGGHCIDRKSTRLNSSHLVISYAVFCLKKKKKRHTHRDDNVHV